MLSAQSAAATILSLVQPLSANADCEHVPLSVAGGRVLALPVMGALDFPHWDNSAMDGYAVRFADLQGCSPETPVTLQVVAEIPAGTVPQFSLAPGQAARLFTGSMLPTGADTVVMQEQTQRQDAQVTILRAPQQVGAFVRHRGDYYRAGSPLLPGGLRLRATELAILAAVQCQSVSVFRRPVVTILSTGNELVEVDQPLGPGQIVNSNQYALAEAVRVAGAESRVLKTAGDRARDLRTAIENALQSADLVISTGGVSVGDYDLVTPVLQELGAEIHVRAVAVKPGKPLTIASFAPNSCRTGVTRPRRLLYCGLPGNPVSALVSFWRFIQPALLKLSGLVDSWGPILVQARTQQALTGNSHLETAHWGHLTLVQGEYEFTLAQGEQTSGNLINLLGVNGLAILGCDQLTVAPGARISALLIHP